MNAWKEAHERLCNGADPTGAAIAAWLVKAGWHSDRILKNFVTRMYGPNHATIWICVDVKTPAYWLNATYVSEGSNALGASHVAFAPLPSESEIAAKLSPFLADAERKINGTFAMRFLA